MCILKQIIHSLLKISLFLINKRSASRYKLLINIENKGFKARPFSNKAKRSLK